MKKVALIGSNGQLGSDLLQALKQSPMVEVTGLAHADIEITNREQTRQVLTALNPAIVINTAAYHRVDEMEDNVARAFLVNGEAVHHLAETTAALDATLVHLSTDYVFGGDTTRKIPYQENDSPAPINVYGNSKLTGEYAVRYINPKHFVLRVSGLYGVAGSSGKGGNFVELMIRLAHEGKPIKVVDDQCLTPTYTWELASKIVELLTTDAYGLYHLTSSGDCTWFEFAKHIFELTGLNPEFEPTTSAHFGARATRPVYSVLDNAALRNTGLADMRPWQEALADYLIQKRHVSAP